MILKYLRAIFSTLVCIAFSGIKPARQCEIYTISHRMFLMGFAYNKKKSEGIGLININSRVETIKWEFNRQPSPSSGTLATIRIPA